MTIKEKASALKMMLAIQEVNASDEIAFLCIKNLEVIGRRGLDASLKDAVEILIECRKEHPEEQETAAPTPTPAES